MSKSYAYLLAAAVTLLALCGVTVLAADTNEMITADTPASSAEPVPAAEAAKRVGETLTVTGKVASVFYLESSDRQPTFLNLDAPFPNQALTVVIFGEDGAKFDQLPRKLFDQTTIAVTGEVRLYKERPEIVVTEPTAIRILSAADAATENAVPSEPNQPMTRSRE